MVKFVILFPGRCGGTWLTTIIDSSRYARVHQEVMPVYPSSEIQQALFTELTRKNAYSRIRAGGFIVKLTDVVSPGALSDFIVRDNVKVIHLFRENLLKQALSFLLGNELKKKFGRMHLASHETGRRPDAFFAEVGKLEKTLAFIEEIDGDLRAFIKALETDGTAVYSLSYEGMCEEPERIAGEVFDFLDLPDKEHIELGRLIKVANNDLSKYLTNYREVKVHFEKTKYDKYIT